jgi:hypothetical protein
MRSLPPRRRLLLRVALALAVATIVLLAAASPGRAAGDPVVMAAGDIACGSTGISTPGACSQIYTSNLLLDQRDSSEGLAAALAIGDLQYDKGTLSGFRSYFDPSWGRLGTLLRPVPGNHEYEDPAGGAAGYFDYFDSIGVDAGGRGKGYYSFDVGPYWHFIALNSSDGCSPVSCAAGSRQESWLRGDLAQNTRPCIVAYWHYPLTYLGAKGEPIWNDLTAAKADLVLVGHDHTYRPPAAVYPSTSHPDPDAPLEVTVGTGGKSGGIFGVLKLTLHEESYDWKFVGSGTTNSGTRPCHNAPGEEQPPPPPPPPPTVIPPNADFSATASGLSVRFADASSNGPTAWRWQFGDGTTSTQQSPTHAYARPGTYTVSLTASNSAGDDTIVQSVTVADAGGGQQPPPGDPDPPPAQPPPVQPPPGAARLSLPAPTGPYPVGVRNAFVAVRGVMDPATHRTRTLPVRVWYPARRAAAGRRARYLTRTVRRAVERGAGLPAGSLDVASPGVWKAPPRARVRGIVLFTPDSGGMAAFQTALISDLASRGYAVVAIDHPHQSAAVREPGGAVIAGRRLSGSGALARALRARARDIGAVLARLSLLAPQRRRSTPVAIAGDGLGGAAAAAAMLAHPEIRAGIDIDGTPRGRVVRRGLGRPFALILRKGGRRPAALRGFIARLRAAHPTLALPAGPDAFTDLALLAPPAEQAAARRAIARERRFLGAFLARALR